MDLPLAVDPKTDPPPSPFKSEPNELRFYPGQAWFTGTGPLGETCAGCAFRHGRRCRKWAELARKPQRKAPLIYVWYAACKYWADASTATAITGD